MDRKPLWERGAQMPHGRAFEAHHRRDTTAQPRVIHSHEYYEIYFFLQGRIRIVIEDVDICPRRGDVLVFPPHCMHRNIHLSAEEPYERFYLYATREFVQTVGDGGYQLGDALDGLLAERGYLYHLNEAALDELLRMTDEAICASSGQTPAEALMNRYRMSMLLLRTVELLGEGTSAGSLNGSMNPLLRYLNDHACEDVSLDRLADTFFISKFALLREFKEYTGLSIHQYVLARRILRAQELIAQGVKPNQVSEMCGFSDYSSFYRAFRQRTGVSPNQYGREDRR